MTTKVQRYLSWIAVTSTSVGMSATIIGGFIFNKGIGIALIGVFFAWWGMNIAESVKDARARSKANIITQKLDNIFKQLDRSTPAPEGTIRHFN